ncbi:chromosome transmission fidelity protein 8 homolog [Leptopilina heterotoma]|uniref:chromosome transmission fidelity protein 8 homolog n=1 Tax=Leptopilina heterotoma TaxID=63436 RepID=UPI001CA8650D|nr:chromosome transmission fidelity protein 8 homolog [Leptopilina heterotoma]
MIIPLRRSDSGVTEWAIVELHGDLKESANADLNLHIGDLAYDKNGIATLIIGNYILTGKETSMDKPIAVLRKTLSTDSIECDKEYLIIAIVKKKLIFKVRPKPITIMAQKS